MKNKMKTVLIYILASLIFLFGILTGYFIAAAIIDTRDGTLSIGTFVFLACGGAAALGVMMLVLNCLNESSDHLHGRRTVKGEVTRWAEHLLFADLLILFLAVLFTRAASADPVNLSPPREQWIFSLAVTAVTASAIAYIVNNSKKQDLRVRIQKIAESGSMHGRRRFVMNVVKVTGGHTVSGHVLGEVHAGDTVWLYYPAGSVHTGRITKLETEGRRVRRAADGDVTMFIRSDVKIPLHCVVSDVEQYFCADGRNAAECPQLVGYIDSYAASLQDQAFIRAMVRTAVTRHFLVPAKKVSETDHAGDLTDTMKQNATVNFPSVTTKNLPDEAVLPIFTDWQALGKYKEIMDDANSVSLVMDLRQCLGIIKEGYSGLVVNPFGPQAFFFSREYLEQILKQERKHYEKS